MASSFLPVQTTAHLVNEDSQWLRTEWDGRAGALAKGRTGGGVWQAPQASSASPSCPALRYCLHTRLQQQQLTGRNTATTNRPAWETDRECTGWVAGRQLGDRAREGGGGRRRQWRQLGRGLRTAHGLPCSAATLLTNISHLHGGSWFDESCQRKLVLGAGFQLLRGA